MIRKGLLEKIERSENDLSTHELNLVTQTFKSFDIDNQGNFLTSINDC